MNKITKIKKSKNYRRFFSKLSNRQGVVAVMVAAFMIIVIGIMALAIDVGRVMVAKNELQNVTDAAALAGAGQLNRILSNMGLPRRALTLTDKETIKATIKDVAKENAHGGKIILLKNKSDEDILSEIIIGKWDSITKEVNPNNLPSDAVSITANDTIDTLFGGIIGQNNFPISATSTSAATQIVMI